MRFASTKLLPRKPRLGLAQGFYVIPHASTLLITAIILAAMLIRFWKLGAESFWLDEVFSARICQRPLTEILDLLPKDKPPLDYYLQAIFQRLGEPETWERVPAALAGVALLPGIYFWTRGWLGRSAALLAIAAAAFNAMLIYYSREARPYSVFCALIVWQQAALAAWWRARARPETRTTGWRALLLIGLLSLLALYTLYAAIIVFLIEVLFLLIAPFILNNQISDASYMPLVSRRTLAFKTAAPFMGMLAIVLLLALPLSAHAHLNPPEDYFWRFETPNLALLSGYVNDYFLFDPGSPKRLGLTACFLSLAALGLYRIWCGNRPAAVQLGMAAALPLPLMLLLYAHIDRTYYSRYSIYAVPPICILTAAGCIQTGALCSSVWRFTARRPSPHIFASILLGGYCLAGPLSHFHHLPSRPDWRGAARHIAAIAQPGDRIVVPGIESICLDYYLKRFARSDLAIFSQGDGKLNASVAPTWEVNPTFESGGKVNSPFFGLTVERLGGEPPPELFEKLIAQWGANPVIQLSQCPPELLGAGWGQPEFWSADFGVRWVTQQMTSFALPIASAAAGQLTIEIMPFSFPKAPPQSLQPLLNGIPLDKRELPQDKISTLVWDIPPSATHRGFNPLILRFAYIHTPAQIQKNYGDFRTLAAAVMRIRWEEAPAR